MRPCRPVAIAMVCAIPAAPALAAGGAHVVDDSAPEDPGLCHVETWLSLGSHRSGLFNLAPACTPRAIPNLELGGYVVHAWTGPGTTTVAGLAAKLNLRSEYAGLGIAIDASAGMASDHRHLDNASLIVPFTLPASTALRLNFNLGWQYSRATGHAAFVGAQSELAVAHDLNWMVEAFGHDHGKAGGQTGLRWNPHRGHVDLDLIAGRYVDGATATSVTFGLTMRI
jgi:hypothetical protein